MRLGAWDLTTGMEATIGIAVAGHCTGIGGIPADGSLKYSAPNPAVKPHFLFTLSPRPRETAERPLLWMPNTRSMPSTRANSA
jgi:hypothetical protein